MLAHLSRGDGTAIVELPRRFLQSRAPDWIGSWTISKAI
jgi:hypothetical protein